LGLNVPDIFHPFTAISDCPVVSWAIIGVVKNDEKMTTRLQNVAVFSISLYKFIPFSSDITVELNCLMSGTRNSRFNDCYNV